MSENEKAIEKSTSKKLYSAFLKSETESPLQIFYSVRKTKRSDIQKIAELEKECFSDAWSESSLLSQLDGESYLTLSAVTEEGELIGYISGCILSSEAEIYRVATKKNLRKQKIGSALLSEFTSILAEYDCERIFLEVRDSNIGARALYASFGFIESGRRKNYYKNPKEDAVLLLKEIERQ